MQFDMSNVEVDPNLLKLWEAWIKWMDHVPFWDPYGASAALAVALLLSGSIVYKAFSH